MILSTIQGFLEDELVPVIQSNVNHELRELQTNNTLFAVPPSLTATTTTTAGNGSGIVTSSGAGGSGGSKKRITTLADTSHVVVSQMSQLLCTRRQQANTATFGYTRGGGGGGGGYGSMGRLPPPLRNVSSSSSPSTSTGHGVPSAAAWSCAHTAVPLFDYWLQLPQHRNMVTTVLDRCILHTLPTHPPYSSILVINTLSIVFINDSAYHCA